MTFKSSANRLLRVLLGFKELIITAHDLRPRKGVLHLWVKPHKNGARCPACGRRGKLLRRGTRQAARDRRAWRDIPVGGLATTIHYSPREILCETHGRVQEDIPWAAPKARVTLRLECQLLRLCKVMTQKEAAAQLGIPKSTAANLLHAAITRHRAGHKIRTRREHKVLAGIGRTQRRIFRACQLKAELAHFWDYRYIGSAEKFLKRWSKSAKLSRLEPLRKFARTIDRHWGAVMASLSGITNAAAEGINRLIRMARNRASGYRSPDNFANMIYLIAGDLDIPVQIAPINRPRQTKRLTHHELCL